MIVLLLALAAHSCPTPKIAYEDAVKGPNLNAAQLATMEHLSACVCGPEGSVDWDPRPLLGGRYAEYPSCNRDGWNGRRYERHPQ